MIQKFGHNQLSKDLNLLWYTQAMTGFCCFPIKKTLHIVQTSM